MKKHLFFLIVFISLLPYKLSAQGFLKELFHDNGDSAYYDKLDDLFTLKLFTAHKFSEFSINDNNLNSSLLYNANPKSIIGVGFSHKWLNLNVGIGINNDVDSTKGETNRIDLNTQIYLRKISIGFYASIYDGYYLANSHNQISGYSADNYYRRPDITNATFGISSTYVFNSKKYSNRATFLQNEWQKKTAGSFLTGGNIVYNQISADSSIIPSQIIDSTFLNGFKLVKSTQFALGADLGYTFTIVAYENWFFDFTIIGGLTLSHSAIQSPDEEKKAFKGGVSITNRAGAGYNSKRFYAGLIYSNIQGNSPYPIDKTGYGYGFGKVQLLVAYRFKVPQKWDVLPRFK